MAKSGYEDVVEMRDDATDGWAAPRKLVRSSTLAFIKLEGQCEVRESLFIKQAKGIHFLFKVRILELHRQSI